jgi:hypothetical protein
MKKLLVGLSFLFLSLNANSTSTITIGETSVLDNTQGCIDYANGWAWYYGWDIGTVQGLNNWTAAFNGCMEEQEQ